MKADVRGEDVLRQGRYEERGQAVVEHPYGCGRVSGLMRCSIEDQRTVSEFQVALVQSLLPALIRLGVFAWRRASKPVPGHGCLLRAYGCDVPLVLLEPQQPGRSERSCWASQKLRAGRCRKAPHQTAGHLCG